MMGKNVLAILGILLAVAGVVMVYVPAGLIAAGAGCGAFWWLFGEGGE